MESNQYLRCVGGFSISLSKRSHNRTGGNEESFGGYARNMYEPL